MVEVKENPLEKLTKDRLNYLGKRMEREKSNYSSYYFSLKIALNKFLDNKE